MGLLDLGMRLARTCGRGHSRVARLLAPLMSDREVVTGVEGCAYFGFSLRDWYWLGLTSRHFSYEPEVAALLRRVRGTDIRLIDCGANYGYWSAFVTAPEYGGCALAVEASPDTAGRLRANAALNGDRFEYVHAALSDTRGATVLISRGRHAGRRITTVDGDPVTTTTIDDVAASVASGRIVIKLDVEGAEIPALRGAVATLARDPLLIYEDHGLDPHHTVTRYIMGELGWRAFSLHPDGVRELRTPDDASAVKLRRRVGYNFAAVAPDSEWRL